MLRALIYLIAIAATAGIWYWMIQDEVTRNEISDPAGSESASADPPAEPPPVEKFLGTWRGDPAGRREYLEFRRDSSGTTILYASDSRRALQSSGPFPVEIHQHHLVIQTDLGPATTTFRFEGPDGSRLRLGAIVPTGEYRWRGSLLGPKEIVQGRRLGRSDAEIRQALEKGNWNYDFACLSSPETVEEGPALLPQLGSRGDPYFQVGSRDPQGKPLGIVFGFETLSTDSTGRRVERRMREYTADLEDDPATFYAGGSRFDGPSEAEGRSTMPVDDFVRTEDPEHRSVLDRARNR